MDSRGEGNAFKPIVIILDLYFRKIILVTVEKCMGCVRKLKACTQAGMVLYTSKKVVIRP